ncbi:mechanosensitive ion channel family protein [Candidatus Gracilibacteria bacterium]|nr:MAG: mechanosensitive ion channel family protein [Candidatus Gracilibacteria bacterium]
MNLIVILINNFLKMSGIIEKTSILSGTVNEVKNISENVSKITNTGNIEDLNTALSIGEKYLKIILDYLSGLWPKLIGAILVLWIGFKIINILNKFIRKSFEKANIDPMIKTFSLSFVSIILKIMVILSAAGMLGVQTTSFIALLTAAGVAIGMSLSSTLQNFAGGIIILAFKLYKIGDFISIGGQEGTVKSIHIFHTILLTLDRKVIIVPNSQISNGTMINFSAEIIRRQDINVGVAYDTDIDFAKKVLLEMAESDKRILNNDEYKINIFVNVLGDSAVTLTIRFFVKTEDLLAVKWDINENILKTCIKNGINIPFPQRDIHIYNK